MPEKKSDGELIIPENVSDRDDYIRGIGKKEAALIAASFVLSMIVVMVLLSVTHDITSALFAALIIISFSIVVVMRDNTNESFIDKVRYLIRYQKMQKKYHYRYYDIFSAYKEDEENADAR